MERLGAGDATLLARMREVVGSRTARITLDDETVDVQFEGGRLVARPPSDDRGVDGDGATDRLTTLELLDGYLEVTDAILGGWLHATGDIENVARIMQAIEIFLDGLTRNPSLQQLARDYREDPCRVAAPPRTAGVRIRRVTLDPAGSSEELPWLRRLDLLP